MPEHPPVPRLRRAHVRAVRLDARAERDVVRLEGFDEQRELVGRRRHVGVGEDDEVGLRCEHPGAHRGALAAVGHDEHPQARPGLGVRCRLRSRPDEVGGAIRAAVVDHEHLDRLGQRRGARRPVAADRVRGAEVTEQLVEGRADPLRLVVGGQHDRQVFAGAISRAV